MKLYEFAKSIGFKSVDVLSKAKDLGLTISSITSNLKTDEEEILSRAYQGVPPPPKNEEEANKERVASIPYDLRKGALIGVVFDGVNFVVVSCNLTLDQIKKNDHNVISDHKNIHGALIEMNRVCHKFVNPNTIKVF